VLFTNSAIEARDHGGAAETLFVEGRNAASVDMARLVGIPAAMIDATAAGASLTYETTQGRNAEFLDYGTSLYADPIAARLSLDDIVPAGQRVEFDTSVSTAITGAGTTAPTED
jgi:phage portal protein BeeE